METPTKKAVNTSPEETAEAVAVKRSKQRFAVNKATANLRTLKVEYVGIDTVFPNNYNPNRQSERDFELLCKSIEEDGFTTPIVCNRTNREIIDGEHRWRAAHVMGYTDIPVVFTDMTPEQMRISTIRHNRARGTHDADLEANVLRDLQELGAIDWAQDALMLDDAELNRLLEDQSAPDALADPEFSSAWVPAKVNPQEAQDLIEGKVTTEVQVRRPDIGDGHEYVSAMSLKAIEAQRDRVLAIQNASSEAERANIRKQHDLYRVYVTYANQEAQLVQAALGQHPAEKLLAMCQKEYARIKVAEGTAQ